MLSVMCQFPKNPQERSAGSDPLNLRHENYGIQILGDKEIWEVQWPMAWIYIYIFLMLVFKEKLRLKEAVRVTELGVPEPRVDPWFSIVQSPFHRNTRRLSSHPFKPMWWVGSTSIKEQRETEILDQGRVSELTCHSLYLWNEDSLWVAA